MAGSAAIELQKALFAALIADKDVAAALPKIDIANAPRVALFDLVPQEVITLFTSGKGPTYATLGQGANDFVPMGEDDGEDDSTELVETTHHPSIHVYSQQVGLLEAKSIVELMCAAIRAAKASIDLPTNRLKLFDPVSAEYRRLEDGFTSHGALTLRAITTPKD